MRAEAAGLRADSSSVLALKAGVNSSPIIARPSLNNSTPPAMRKAVMEMPKYSRIATPVK